MWRGWVMCLITWLVLSNAVKAQSQHGFRISFADKVGTEHSLSNPLTFLSQRSLDRRTAQGIALDNTDLPVSARYVDSILTLTGGKLHITSRWFNYAIVLVSDSADILALQNKPYISKIEYMALYQGGLHKPGRTAEDTTQFTPGMKTTGSADYYGDAYRQTSLVRGDYLHDIGRKGQGKLIAVLDEGFTGVNTSPAFDSMMQSGRMVDGFNYSNISTNVFTNGQHGTSSLSTIAGNLPGIYVGSAPYADYALYITEISGSEQEIEMDNIVAASERADSVGADVITISLGYDAFSAPAPRSLTYAQINGSTTIAARGANMATTKGILFVATAGNEGGGSWNYILTPGDADSALTIGNVAPDGTMASNSSYGPNSSGRVKPDVCAQGNPAYIIRGGSLPTTAYGTSLSTPQMAGWAVCLMQSATGTALQPWQVRSAIQKSAHLFNTPGPHTGYGIPNFHTALETLNVEKLPQMPNAQNWINVGPNPFDDEITIRFYLQRRGNLQWILTDISGRVIFTQEQAVISGVQTFKPNLPALQPGIYILKAIAGDQQAVTKIVKR